MCVCVRCVHARCAGALVYRSLDLSLSRNVLCILHRILSSPLAEFSAACTCVCTISRRTARQGRVSRDRRHEFTGWASQPWRWSRSRAGTNTAADAEEKKKKKSSGLTRQRTGEGTSCTAPELENTAATRIQARRGAPRTESEPTRPGSKTSHITPPAFGVMGYQPELQQEQDQQQHQERQQTSRSPPAGKLTKSAPRMLPQERWQVEKRPGQVAT